PAAGVKFNGNYTSFKNAGFIAKYDLDGNFVEAVSFAPESLPAVNSGGAGAILFHINQVACSDDKIYFAASYTGSTKVGDLTVEGTYTLLDFGFFSMSVDATNSSIFSLDLETLKTATIEMSAVNKTIGETVAEAGEISFDLDGNKLYASFFPNGKGTITVKNGSLSRDLDMNTNDEAELYVLTSPSALTKLEKTPANGLNSHQMISTLIAERGKIYMVGSAAKEIPSSKVGFGDEITGATDIFVATFNASDLSNVSVVTDAVDEGKTEFTNSDETTEMKPNYEIPVGAVTANDAIFISKMTKDFNGGYISVASRLFNGEQYSTPVDAYKNEEIPGGMGIARNNGAGENPSYNYACIVLPSSSATEFTFNGTSFNQDIIPVSILSLINI
ncbi:MAG: hypothetical protein K2K72_07420, partial [Duncaniella sp.]|nr:hypothetical protein [Duncaniella sp.]